MHWNTESIKIDHPRPHFYATQGTAGTARMAPRLYDALIAPINGPATAYVLAPLMIIAVPKSDICQPVEKCPRKPREEGGGTSFSSSSLKNT